MPQVPLKIHARELVSLKVAPREEQGKGPVGQMRRLHGQLPGVIYGHKQDAECFKTDAHSLERILSKGGQNAIILIEHEESSKESEQALIREIQYHKVSGDAMHLDLLRIDPTETLRANVPIITVGVPEGVRTEAGAIAVDGRMQTKVAGIYAIGDVVGAPQLAHVAASEGVAAVEFIAGHKRQEIDPTLIPSCIYCQPQVASVGLDEEGARAAGYDVKVGRFPFAASGKAQASGETEGLVKLVFDAKYGEVLGASIVGAEATELIAEIGLARKLEATYEELVGTMHAHPTFSEAVMEAAGEAFGMGLNL